MFVWKRRKQVLQPRGKGFPEGQKFIARCPKKTKKIEEFSKKILTKVFIWTHRIQFWQRSPQNNSSMAKKDRKLQFSEKNLFLPKMFPRSRTMRFWQTCSVFSPEGEIFLIECLQLTNLPWKRTLNVRKWWEKWKFFKNNFLLETFLWTRRVQFWQPCQLIFRQMLKNLHWMSENDK